MAYVTAEKTMAETATIPDNDPIIQMLTADPMIDLSVMVVADDAVLDLSGYDAVVAQEGFGSSSAIFMPGGSLGLANIPVPFVYNKTYALRDGKAVNSGGGTSGEAAGLSLMVDSVMQGNALFNGITFTDNAFDVFKATAEDDGSSGSKSFNYTSGLTLSDSSTLLANTTEITDPATSILVNDIPAGTTVGDQVTMARMIAFGMNFGAISMDDGDNMTLNGLTLWRNAVYLAAGIEVPSEPANISSEIESVTASVGTLSTKLDDMAMQLNLPTGTSTAELMVTTVDPGATVTLPEINSADGTTQMYDIVVHASIGKDSSVYQLTVHTQAEEEVLFVSNSDGVLSVASADVVTMYNDLVNAGYSVSLANKLAINTAGFDYSPYSGIVIGPGVGSSWVNYFAIDGYPLPCLTMQHDGPRSGKWGWVGTDKDDDMEMNVVKTADDTPVDSVKMQITNNSHYITEGYQLGELVEWNSGTADSADWTGKEVKSYNLAMSIPTAIALGRIPVDGSALTSWWAVPRGSVVNTRGEDGTYTDVTLSNRIVVLDVFTEGLLYATEAFDTMFVRSFDWVMGAGGTVGIDDFENLDRVSVYPNPASSYAKVRIDLSKQQNVSLSLINLVGQKIEITTRQLMTPGVNEISINTQNLREGMYIYLLETENNVYKGKLNITR